MHILSSFCNIAMKWIRQDLTDDYSTLFGLMSWLGWALVVKEIKKDNLIVASVEPADSVAPLDARICWYSNETFQYT